MMRIRITRCSDTARWYAGNVGETFDVAWVDSEGYWTREPSGYRNVVLKQDAEVLS